jgi:putative hemolysin
MLIKIIIFFVLLALSGFFSASETAFMSLGKFKFKEYIKEKKPNYQLVQKLKSKPHILISTVLIGNNIVNLGAAAVATLLSTELFLSFGWNLSESWSAGIMTGIITILVLIFGEVIPKNYAAKHYEKVASASSKILYFLSKVFYPIIYSLDFINRRLIPSATFSEDKITEEEIKTIVNVGSDEGGIDFYEKTLIHRIFQFDDILTKEVMTPRPKVFVLSADITMKDALKEVSEDAHSRIPVFEDNLDNIIGFIHIQDLLRANLNGLENKPLKHITNKCMYIPESKPIDDLFREMQHKKVQIAIVVDEFGGFSGIVTLEDLIEEIVGEIYDEDEKKIKLIKKTGKKEYLIDGHTTIREIKDSLKIKLEDSFEAETISSYILNKIGRIPEKEEVITIKNIKIIVKDVTETTIQSVKLKY